MKEELFKKIAEIIAENNHIPIETIKPESTFEELGMDSLDGITLINDLEKHYNLQVSNVEVVRVKSVQEAIESLEKVFNEQHAV